ncbi:retrovirus-related pol polyprotein from transposon TNT 1-94, partial [Tanacetum coccineum]
MERGFLSQKGSGVVRSVKEKDLNVANRKTVKDGVIPPIIIDPNSIASNFEVVMDGTEPSAIGASGNIQVENMGQSSSGPSLPTQDATSDGNAPGKSLEDTIVLGSFPPLPTQATTPAGNAPGKSSYANVTSKPSEKKLNIPTLFTPGGNGIDVIVPVESIRAISDRFDNTAYGFFLGNGWHTMLLLTISIEGLDTVLENGPWFIQNNPFILKKWHPDENLLKEDVSTIPVWVKLHGVPVTAFSDNGLSAIATKLG